MKGYSFHDFSYYLAGACGITARMLLAILGAIGRAARSGVIIKGDYFLTGHYRAKRQGQTHLMKIDPRLSDWL